ncbi:hypothetical protein [Calidithermus timidus]|uniref:hypothetical protein n=1 Tax=Calidithermus timidus TaxID=307124 RepID=UPI0012F638D0|nr:hypothetical protein [Calidithermus timidus]
MLTPQRLLPRFLYVYVRVPILPIPLVFFIPTLGLEGLAYLAGRVTGRWNREAAYYLEQARIGLRLIRRQGAFTMVDVELGEIPSGIPLRSFRGPVRVKIGQW